MHVRLVLIADTEQSVQFSTRLQQDTHRCDNTVFQTRTSHQDTMLRKKGFFLIGQMDITALY
jgi:hypothetical protein